jgi:hypothetical protein
MARLLTLQLLYHFG